MKTYSPKKLIEGYKLSMDKDKFYIAVSEKLCSDELLIEYGTEKMYIKKGQEPLKKIIFDDRYGRGQYTLCYFEWKPTMNETPML